MPPRNRLLVVAIALCAVVLVGLLGWRWAWDSSRLLPERGGVYIEAVAGQPQFINPLLADFNELDRDLVSLVFAGLVRISPSGEVVGDLAQSWQASPDATSYTFVLNPDRKWHDGRGVTPEDVLYTVGLLQDPAFPGLPDTARPWQGIKVVKVDERTVRFSLPGPNASFLELATLGLLPSHILRDVKAADLPNHAFNGSPIGAGPMKVLQASVKQVALVPDPAHPDSKLNLESIVFRFYPSARAAVTALTQGEATGVRFVPAAETEEVEQSGGARVYRAPQYGREALMFLNVNRAPLDDPKVRRALSLAVDRKAIVNDGLSGWGEPATGPLSPLSWGYTKAQGDGFDRTRAASLLEEAGWRDGNGDGVREKDGKPLAFTISTSDAQERVRVANAVASQLATVGVKAEVMSYTWEELRDTQLVPRKFAAALAEVSLPNRDPDVSAFWHSSQAEEGLNFSGWRNAKADELLSKGRQTVDAAVRRQVYAEFQSLFADETPAIFLYYPTYQYALSNEIKGAQLAPLLDPSDRLRGLADWYIRERRVFFP